MRRAIVLAAALVAGCGHFPRVPGLLGGPTFDEAGFAAKDIPTYRLRREPGGAPTETVIGSVRHYKIRQGDTLLDVARYYDLGYNEIVDANPGVDAFVPPVGTEVVLPTASVLPCCSYEGIVVNIPEMRLYYFRPDPDDARTIRVTAYPVGLGRDDWRTPRGKFRVRAKTVNPRWNIPESIRREHIRERGDDRTFIPGGDPENPLGKYRLQLTRSLYGIHGTDIPWGVGMQVTHGCVRLYPEDIERLYPDVPIGTPVEFVYQPVKVGRRRGAVYVEVHRDIYKYTGSLAKAARRAIAHQGVASDVDARRVDAALKEAAGLPVRVSPDDRVARTGE